MSQATTSGKAAKKNVNEEARKAIQARMERAKRGAVQAMWFDRVALAVSVISLVFSAAAIYIAFHF